jgi:GAF domain-containing protein
VYRTGGPAAVTSNNPDPGDVHRALEQLGSLALREHSMETLLQRVVDLTKVVMPGHIEASITLLVNDKPTTAVFTGQLALDCDESQFGRGYGPCLHAATSGEMTYVEDTRTDPRWRDYMERAAERGALSSLSVPLPISEGLAGGMNIYAREPHAFGDAETQSAATQFVPYAAVAVANMHAYQDARTMADNLHLALESRAVIDQAKGILMERYKLTPDEAFQVLARISMQRNTKLRAIAEDLVITGQLPGTPPRG